MVTTGKLSVRAAEGVDDRFGVRHHHPQVGVGPRLGVAQGVGKQFATNPHRVSLRLAGLDNRLHDPRSDRRLDKHRRQFFLDHQVNDRLHMSQIDLVFSTHPFEALGLNAIGVAVIAERIVGGDHQTLIGGDRVNLRLAPLVEFQQLLAIGCGVAAVTVGMFGVDLGKLLGDHQHAIGPDRGVVPDVGIGQGIQPLGET